MLYVKFKYIAVTNIILKLWILVLIICVQFSSQQLYEGDECVLHNGSKGVCTNENECKWLFKNLNSGKMTHADIKLCGFSNSDAIVCCGDKEPVSTPTPKPNCPLAHGSLIFDANCIPANMLPVATPKPTTNVPSRITGEKIGNACQEYSKFAHLFLNNNILNGSPAELGEFPHMAALGYSNANGGYDFDCGGSLISNLWIITAAHCSTSRRTPVIARMRRTYVDIVVDDEEGVDRNIVSITRHPNYDAFKKKNDIALIKVDAPIPLDDFVRPACIRTDYADISPNIDLTISGWGSTEAARNKRSEALLKATVTSLSIESCNATLSKYNELANQPSLRSLSNSQMCAYDQKSEPGSKSDACVGDSGGPIFLYDRSTGVSTLVGVTSFGVSCGTALPSIYTRIAYYADWIESTVWPST